MPVDPGGHVPNPIYSSPPVEKASEGEQQVRPEHHRNGQMPRLDIPDYPADPEPDKRRPGHENSHIERGCELHGLVEAEVVPVLTFWTNQDILVNHVGRLTGSN